MSFVVWVTGLLDVAPGTGGLDCQPLPAKGNLILVIEGFLT